MKPLLHFATIYVEDYNLSVTPVIDKVPIIKAWQKIRHEEILSDYYANKWEKANGIGMLTGEPSGLIALDIDIKTNDSRLRPLLDKLLNQLPPILLGRIGNPLKPPARFYKYNGEKNKKWKHINVELLSTGNQILLPPSFHPETNGRYRWSNKRLSQVKYEEIPDLLTDIYNTLDEANDFYKPKKLSNGSISTNLEPSKGRCNHGSHNAISAFAVAKYREGMVKPDLIDAVLKYDAKINKSADYIYFQCPSRKWKSKFPTTNAKAFIDQIYNNPERQGEHAMDKAKPKSNEPGANLDFRWEDDKGTKRPSNLYEDYVSLFEFMYPTARKDYFNNTVFHKKGESWEPIENQLKLIRAEARICGLVVTHVEDNLYKWLNSKPPKLLIDLPKWDEKDHIKEVLSYISVKNLEHDEFVSLFKAWLAGVFKRVYHPAHHNQCIIFKGQQGIGKDMFFGNIFESLENYYSEVILQAKQKDNYESIEPLMVSYLPEFDESSRIPISTIKAFISASKATFRGAYDRKASSHIFRHSVVSSANFDNILRDPTGNRRFWIFEVDKIDWKYNDILDSGQFMAQAFNLYKEGYEATPVALEAMRAYIKDATPKSSEDLFIEEFEVMLRRTIEMLKGYKDAGASPSEDLRKLREEFHAENEKVRWYMISEKVNRIASRYKLGNRVAQSIIKNKGYSDADRKTTYYVLPSQVVKEQPRVDEERSVINHAELQ